MRDSDNNHHHSLEALEMVQEEDDAVERTMLVADHPPDDSNPWDEEMEEEEEEIEYVCDNGDDDILAQVMRQECDIEESALSRNAWTEDSSTAFATAVMYHSGTTDDDKEQCSRRDRKSYGNDGF